MRPSLPNLVVPLALLLAACGGPAQDAGTGKLSVMLTDAPGDFKAAVVTITEVDLVGSGGTLALSKQKVTTNLLTLANDTAKLVDEAVVPVGTYSELRFVISGGYVEVAQAGGGSIIYASSPTYEGLPPGAQVGGTLRMPSFAQSGLKIDLPGGSVTVGTEAKVLLVDFDVAQSFGHEAGNSGAWVMHPVVKATDFGLSGTLNVAVKLGAGVALPAAASLDQLQVTLTNSGGSVKTLTLAPAASGDGTYAASFKYLIPGDYSVDFLPLATATLAFAPTPALPDPVKIESGQPTNVEFVVTSASAPAPTTAQ